MHRMLQFITCTQLSKLVQYAASWLRKCISSIAHDDVTEVASRINKGSYSIEQGNFF